MKRSNGQLQQAGSAHAIAAWLFLAASVVAGIVGVMRMYGADRTAGGTDCLCLAILLAIIAAVLGVLGIHRQNAVLYDALGPTFQGSHGSGDEGDGV
jgi:hypothetical protein